MQSRQKNSTLHTARRWGHFPYTSFSPALVSRFLPQVPPHACPDIRHLCCQQRRAAALGASRAAAGQSCRPPSPEQSAARGRQGGGEPPSPGPFLPRLHTCARLQRRGKPAQVPRRRQPQPLGIWWWWRPGTGAGTATRGPPGLSSLPAALASQIAAPGWWVRERGGGRSHLPGALESLQGSAGSVFQRDGAVVQKGIGEIFGKN